MKKEKIIDFLIEANKLKYLKRTGWVALKVKNSEHVGDHVYSMIMLASVLADKLKVNKQKLMEMILIHELPELYVGDIATIFGTGTIHKTGYMYTLDKNGKIKEFKGNKRRLEENAMKKILNMLPTNVRKKYYRLWKEFEKNKTPLAHAAHDLDRLDHTVLALLYKDRTKIKLDGFINVESRLKTKYAKELHKLIRKRFYK